MERTDCVQQADGLKPQLFLRSQAVAPRYDTLPGSVILKRLAERMGVGGYFPFETMEDLVQWQLEGTGFTLEDFAAKGFVSYAGKQIFWTAMMGSSSRRHRERSRSPLPCSKAPASRRFRPMNRFPDPKKGSSA